MLRILATIFAGLFGLVFGSFLNVCVSRWPEGESIVHPPSHCPACGRTLTWWENIPVLSWLALRGKCRTCGATIGVRHLLVEFSIGALWALATWNSVQDASFPDALAVYVILADTIGKLVFCWLLVGLATLDAEHFWLPDWLTLPGIGVGFAVFLIHIKLNGDRVLSFYGATNLQTRLLIHLTSHRMLAILAAAALILLIRWLYWLIRRREGLGLGDVKLLAMLAAWLGLPGALLALFLGIVVGAVAAVGILLSRRSRPGAGEWAAGKLPFGTFLSIGGIVSALWGQAILAAYMRWAGF